MVSQSKTSWTKTSRSNFAQENKTRVIDQCLNWARTISNQIWIYYDDMREEPFLHKPRALKNKLYYPILSPDP